MLISLNNVETAKWTIKTTMGQTLHTSKTIKAKSPIFNELFVLNQGDMEFEKFRQTRIAFYFHKDKVKNPLARYDIPISEFEYETEMNFKEPILIGGVRATLLFKTCLTQQVDTSKENFFGTKDCDVVYDKLNAFYKKIDIDQVAHNLSNSFAFQRKFLNLDSANVQLMTSIEDSECNDVLDKSDEEVDDDPDTEEFETDRPLTPRTPVDVMPPLHLGSILPTVYETSLIPPEDLVYEYATSPRSPRTLSPRLELNHRLSAGKNHFGMTGVKVVVIDMTQNSLQYILRKLVSPLASILTPTNFLGLYHTAVMVGPYYFEWNSTSICLPRHHQASKAVLVLDLHEFQYKDRMLEAYMDHLSQLICRWNVERTYDRLNCNCQHFVDDVLKCMNIKMDFKGSIKDFINNLRVKGNSALEYRVPKEIREKCQFKDSTIVFNTHKELDEFCSKINENVEVFQQKYAEDYLLLKGFDRAFWLKLFRDRKNPVYAYSKGKNGECECPFSDPERTFSFQSQ
jgi:hypothetical protein